MKQAIEALQPYTKTIVAFIVGCLQVAALYINLTADGNLSSEDLVTIISAIVIALGGTGLVYQLPNKK